MFALGFLPYLAGPLRCVFAAVALIACALLIGRRDAQASSVYPDTTSLVSTVAYTAATQLDSSLNPVIAVSTGSQSITMIHCNDAECQGGDESQSTIALSGYPSVESLLLDAGGNPTVLFAQTTSYAYFDLRLLHCGDETCASGNVLSSLAHVPYNGCCVYYLFAFDSNGYPVITYSNAAGELHLIRCNDANCANSDDPNSILTTGTSSSQVALDASDNPVIAFSAHMPDRLGVLHCNDPSCAGGDDVPQILTPPSPITQAGFLPALKLDSAGNPIIAYWTNYGLVLTHCNDASCSGNDEANVLGPSSATSGPIVLSLDSAARPVSVYDGDGGPTLARCSDTTCSTGIETSRIRVTTLAARPDLAFDASDRPIVTYPAFPTPGVWIVHCGTVSCDTDTDGDGCSDLSERSTGSQLERFGANRDAKNPWDYFNPTHDGQNRIDDVLIVAAHYGKNTGDPGYSTDYDRTYIGPNAWNLGPPNGQIRIDDVLMQLRQYNHDCS